jgi:hypothetical protein
MEGWPLLELVWSKLMAHVKRNPNRAVALLSSFSGDSYPHNVVIRIGIA